MIPLMYTERVPELIAELERSLPGKVSGDIHKSLQIAPETLDAALKDLVERLAGHYPFHQPFYAGQMLKPPHPAAWLAYALAMTINPNNHALDGGPVASYMEKEVVREWIKFTGFPETGIGHLTSSGTIANLEALWVARERHPDRPVAISSQAHYTHRRMCHVLRHPVVEIPDGADGLPDPERLKDVHPLPGTIVVTLGTTGQGTVEPLHRILPWARDHDVRIHLDAAYGGFFHLLRDTGWIDPEPWRWLSRADSMVIDPHKHGLQPYGCGSVMFRDPAAGRFYKHDSPYTYFTSGDLHLGEISLECSRAGSAAVALWLTLQLLPLTPLSKNSLPTGLGRILISCRKAALRLFKALETSENYRPVVKPELDIVTFLPETREQTYSEISRRSAAILKKGMQVSADEQLYLSTLDLNEAQARRLLPGLKADEKSVKVLRSVLMKPEHFDFIPEMMSRLDNLYHRSG